MRKLINLLLLIAVFQANAQNTKEDKKSSTFFKNLKSSYLSIVANEKFSEIANFSSIKFIDARYDTTSIGFVLAPGYYKRLMIKGGLENYLNSCFEVAAQKEKPSLLCIIHDFIVSETDTLIDKNFNRGNPTNRLHVRIDAFVEGNQSFKAAFRYDTALMNLNYKSKDKLDVVNFFCESFVNRLGRIDMNKLAQKKSYTIEEIKESIQEKYNLPILTDASLVKGVYMTCKDFTNNKPTYTEYEIKKEERVDFLYTKSTDGTSSLLRNAFGYCDGQNIWVSLNKNFFLLHRSDNGFEFLGFNGLVRSRSALGSSPYSTYRNPSGVLPMLGASSIAFDTDQIVIGIYRPFVLDMEKGTVF